MIADVIHIVLHVPYLASSVCFAVALAIIFVAWFASERTLSIHSIYTLRRELFYWSTVMATFALGTAVGDMTASTLHLGYFVSGLLFAALFALPALGYRLFGLNAILAFWIAYVMTRPFGASFADWFGKPQSFSGLGLGTGLISLVLADRHSQGHQERDDGRWWLICALMQTTAGSAGEVVACADGGAQRSFHARPTTPVRETRGLAAGAAHLPACELRAVPAVATCAQIGHLVRLARHTWRPRRPS